MRTLIIGAHGKIGRLLCERAGADGLDVVAMIRDPAQRADMGDVDCVVADLEADPAPAFQGIEQVVFTAGSGPRTGLDKTLLVDLWGAVRAIDLAAAHHVRHFIMVSALRAAEPLAGPEKLRPYLVAKNVADRCLRSAPLHATILAPGRLTDEPGTGRVRTVIEADEPITIPRADVAAALRVLLDDPVPGNCTIPLVSGEQPIAEALRQA